MLLEDWVVAAALLSVENVEVLLLLVDEEEEAVETQALQNVDCVVDHTSRIDAIAIAEWNLLPIFALSILVFNILLKCAE